MYTNMNNPFRNSKPPLLWGCLQRVKHIHHHLHLFNQHRSFECSFLLHELYYYLSSTSSFSTAFYIQHHKKWSLYQIGFPEECWSCVQHNYIHHQCSLTQGYCSSLNPILVWNHSFLSESCAAFHFHNVSYATRSFSAHTK